MDLIAFYNEQKALHAKWGTVDWQKVADVLMNGAMEIGKERDELRKHLAEAPPEAGE